jgi:hypothetical protein
MYLDAGDRQVGDFVGGDRLLDLIGPVPGVHHSSLSPCQDNTRPVIDRMNGDLDMIGPVLGVHHSSLPPCQDNTRPIIDRVNEDLDLIGPVPGVHNSSLSPCQDNLACNRQDGWRP